MKLLISTVLIFLLSLTLCLYLPWWTIAIVAFLVTSLIAQNPGRSFLSGFIALFILWGGLAWYLSSNNDHILAHKMSQIILKIDNPALLILVTALVGALVAGFAALAGSFVRRKSE